MKTLYIIGNGFDIDHKLDTDYCCFYKWLRGTNHQGAKEFSDSINGLTKVDLWSRFEEALGKIRLYDYIKYIKEEWDIQKADDWTGQADAISAGLENYTEGQYHDLIEAFQEWAITLHGEAEDVDPKYYGLRCRHNYFINFNYTDTLELVYGVKSQQILYIHGDSTGETEIIVGHDHEYQDDRVYIGELLDKEIPGDDGTIQDILIRMFNSSQKKTGEVIRNHLGYFNDLKHAKIKRIIVLGHSYGKVDLPYFEKIKEICPKAKWELSWYSCGDYKRAQALIRKYNISAVLVPVEAYKDPFFKRVIKLWKKQYPTYEQKLEEERKKPKKTKKCF